METRKATRSGPHAQNGLTIWRARKRKGLTQERLAAAAGISRIQMIKLENGMHLPKPETCDRLATALGLKPGTIKSEQEVGPRSDTFRGGAGADVVPDDRRTRGASARGKGDLAA